MKIAVVGSGIAGLGAAWSLSRQHDVTVFEANSYVGGHANTVTVSIGDRVIPVDTGFIVFNDWTYPQLTRLFSEIQAPIEASDMSFSVSVGAGQLEYAGSLSGLLAQPSNLLRPRFWRMVKDIARFYREAPGLLSADAQYQPTLGGYLQQKGYSADFIYDHILPMGAAIWSTSIKGMFDFPARTFIRFCVNHGLLLHQGRPQWRTVSGGSREYIRRLCAPFQHQIRLHEAVVGLRRTARGAFVETESGQEHRFDHVVLACHSNQALQILGPDATVSERELLRQIRYEDNFAVLHQDMGLMPRRRRAWASWNYLATGEADEGRAVSVTYWMNRLQNIDQTIPLFVSLNPLRRPDPAKVLASSTYAHPLFDQAALDAQESLHEIQGVRRTWFCGAYCGFGFHEDGLEAGLSVAAELGAPAPWANEVTPMSPAWRAVRTAVAMAAE